MIFECGPSGADKTVCIQLAKRLNADLRIVSRTLDNKPSLVANCGRAAADLFDQDCDRVIIVWDLYPAWRERGGKPCRKEDRDAVFDSLNAAGVDIDNVHLVCIEEELEAWLLADNRALSEVLSRPHRKARIKQQRDPERGNPKTRLNRIFREHSGRKYSDRLHALPIVNAMPDLNRIGRIDSFRRFAQKVADVEL